jgi:hypothetical protein
MTIGEEFVERAAVLRNLHFEEATGRLKSFIDWMEAQPVLQNILTALRRKADGPAIMLQGNRHRPPPANSPEEIASVGLALMETCRNEDFAGGCVARGIAPSYRTNAVQAYVDEA